MFRFVAAPRSSSAGTNNLPPLTFHQVHGDNIRLCNGGTIARRHESFCKGVTFSARPVRVGEKVSHRAINMVLGCITQEIEIDILFHGTQRKSSMICIHKKQKKTQQQQQSLTLNALIFHQIVFSIFTSIILNLITNFTELYPYNREKRVKNIKERNIILEAISRRSQWLFALSLLTRARNMCSLVIPRRSWEIGDFRSTREIVIYILHLFRIYQEACRPWRHNYFTWVARLAVDLTTASFLDLFQLIYPFRE